MAHHRRSKLVAEMQTYYRHKAQVNTDGRVMQPRTGRAAAMLVVPDSRRMMMAKLRRLAINARPAGCTHLGPVFGSPPSSRRLGQAMTGMPPALHQAPEDFADALGFRHRGSSLPRGRCSYSSSSCATITV